MAINGVLRVQLALKESLSELTIKRSFDKAGISPFSIETILDNFTGICMKDRNLVKDSMNILVEEIMVKGEIKDDVFDRLNISGRSKDSKVINQRRSIILTNDAYRKLEVNKREAVAAKEAEKLVNCLQCSIYRQTLRRDIFLRFFTLSSIFSML
jgi:hypothetical protein